VPEEDGDERYMTESQKEWRDWSAHGYRKLYMPQSVRRIFFVCTLGLIVLLLVVFWLAAQGRYL
jgi:hypothetical protein